MTSTTSSSAMDDLVPMYFSYAATSIVEELGDLISGAWWRDLPQLPIIYQMRQLPAVVAPHVTQKAYSQFRGHLFALGRSKK